MSDRDVILEAVARVPENKKTAMTDSAFYDAAVKEVFEMADCLSGKVNGLSRRGALEALGKIGLLLASGYETYRN